MKTPRYILQKIDAPLCQLGEGLCWDKNRNLIWWLDIEGYKIYNMCMDTHTVQVYDTTAIVGCIVLDTQNRLIAYNDLEIQVDNDKDNTFIPLTNGFTANFKDVLANDGKTDRQGRLLLGTKHTTCQQNTAGVQRINSLSTASDKTLIIDNITVANGPAFSPNGDKMYFADSPSGHISVYDYDSQRGTVGKKRIFATPPAGTYPDGMTVDKDGYLWQALWNGKTVQRYNPDGECVMELVVPDVLHVTNVCFGGADMKTLFITTAYSGMTAIERQQYPDSGAVFMAHIAHTHGIAETPVKI